MVRNALTLLDTLTNIFPKTLLFVIQGACGEDLFNMRVGILDTFQNCLEVYQLVKQFCLNVNLLYKLLITKIIIRILYRYLHFIFIYISIYLHC